MITNPNGVASKPGKPSDYAMPQSLSRVLIHSVFSTKNRTPLLRDPEFRDQFHAYLGGCTRTLDCHPIQIGGTEDHIHLLTTLSRTIAIADFIKEIKRNSTIWAKKTLTKISHGKRATDVSPFPNPKFPSLPATSRHRKTITAKSRFRMNPVSYCVGTGRNGTSVMCGIEALG